jgi:malonate-semialdehyde dehydrogenase (acetylating)/methylmalonate-semialdehyde dehydrogenase
VVTPVGEKTAKIRRAKLLAAIESLRVGILTDPDADYARRDRRA